jgi:hypothetical protein
MSDLADVSTPDVAVPDLAPSESPTPGAGAVDAMIAAAGLSMTPEERERLLEMYALYRPGIEALYALPEARYEAPALVFQAAPKLTAWGA